MRFRPPESKPGDPLTDKQRAIFEFIVEHIKEYGSSPTVREIGNKFGIKSPNGVMCHIRSLRKKGMIGRNDNGGDYGLARSSTILAGVVCPHCQGLGRILPDGDDT